MYGFKRLGTCAIAALGVAPMMAVGAQPGWYLALGAGQARYADAGSHAADWAAIPPAAGQGWTVDTLESGVRDFDDTRTAYRFSVGYQFNANWALEAGYADFGEVRATGDGSYQYSCFNPGGPCTQLIGVGSYTTSSSLRASGWDIDLVGDLPLSSHWALFARLGAFDAHTRFTTASVPTASTGEALPLSLRSSSTEWEPDYGVGVDLIPTEHWSWRLGWNRFVHLGDSRTSGSFDLDFWSLGVAYRL